MSAAFGKYHDLDDVELHVGEPAFVLRAQDALAPYALQSYASLLRAAAAGEDDSFEPTAPEPGEGSAKATALRTQANEVDRRAAQMLAWQAAHVVKLPD